MNFGRLKKAMLGVLIVGVAIVSLLVASCATLTPYDEVEEKLSSGQLIEVNGQKVHVEIAGDGEPLVLLHGFAASTYSFHQIIPLLATRFRVIAIDLNGFGYTERPREMEAFGPLGQLEMVQSVLQELKVDSAAFVGHSYGGLLSLLLAGTEPAKVTKLILISPATE
ncbi:MAG: alpha/beta fold hydrolase, partial [Verrucomicrobiota bacterium]